MAAGSSTVGEVRYIVDVDTSGLTKGLDGAEKTVAKAANGNLKKGFAAIGKAALVGVGAAATAIAGLTGAAVKSFADYEQLTGGVETLFKENADMVMGYAEQAFRTAGLSANQYMETVTGFSASLLQGLGGDTVQAASIADMAITDMADNANKMGSSMESIQTAYQGFAKQNYTMLDNLKLGYGGTKTEMQRLLSDAEKMPEALGQKFDLSNYADIIKAINVVQQNMDITGTTAKEANETISGSLNATKAAWDNLMTSLVSDSGDEMIFDSFVQDLVDSAGNLIKNLLPVVQSALSGIVLMIKDLAPVIIELLPTLFETLLPPLLEAATNLTLQLVAMLPQLVQTIFDALLVLLPTLIDALVEILPQLMTAITNLVITIAQKLTEPQMLTTLLNGAIQLFMAIAYAVPDIVLALVDALPSIIDSVIQWMTDPATIMLLVGASVQLFMGIVQAVPKILGALLGVFGNLFKSLWSGIKNIFTGFGGQVAGAIGDALKSGINGILGSVEKAINKPFDLLNGAIGIINNIPGVNIGRIPRLDIPRMQYGGVLGGDSYSGDRQLFAGNSGEMVINREDQNRLWDFIKGGGQTVGGGGVTINIFGTFATSESEQRRVAEQIWEQFEIIKRQRMGVMA